MRCCWALMLRTGWVVVRRTVRVSSPPRSMVMVSAVTWTVTMRPAWMRPRAIFYPAIMITPVLLAIPWAVTGAAEGCGGGPAGRAPRRRRAWSRAASTGSQARTVLPRSHHHRAGPVLATGSRGAG